MIADHLHADAARLAVSSKSLHSINDWMFGFVNVKSGGSLMRLITRAHDRWLFSILLILSIVSFAVPHAQDDASDEFILFASDRAFPSQLGICPACEDIYVMPPAGELPGVPNAIRLTAGSGVDSASYNSAGPDWSRAKKLIAFQSNRPTDPVNRPLERIPQIYLMNPDGTGQQLLVNLPRGAAFPSFSHNGNELCFQARPCRAGISTSSTSTAPA